MKSLGYLPHTADIRMKIQGSLEEELAERNIFVWAGSRSGVSDESPIAYKDIDEVIEVVHQAGIAKKVARLRPLSVIKG